MLISNKVPEGPNIINIFDTNVYVINKKIGPVVFKEMNET